MIVAAQMVCGVVHSELRELNSDAQFTLCWHLLLQLIQAGMVTGPFCEEEDASCHDLLLALEPEAASLYAFNALGQAGGLDRLELPSATDCFSVCT